MQDAKNKSVGCLVGLAIGDALGMPTEGIGKTLLKELYGGAVQGYENPSPHYPNSHLKAGQWTDDTRQAIALAKSLNEQ